MKKLSFILLCFLLSTVTQAQNTFPSSGNVGIGTTSPVYPLEVNGDISTNARLLFTGSGTGMYTLTGIYNNTSFFKIDLARISNTHYTTPIDFVISGRGGGDFFVRKGSTGEVSFNDNNGNNLFRINGSGDVGIGTTNPQSKLAVNGTVTAKQVKVTQSGWPDYVFDSSYKLPPLLQIEGFIQQNKHLPEIPSAKEIESNGLNLGEIVLKQMQKIEELTLYQINSEKMIKQLQSELKAFKQELTLLTQETKAMKGK